MAFESGAVVDVDGMDDSDSAFTAALLANDLRSYSFDLDALRQWMVALYVGLPACPPARPRPALPCPAPPDPIPRNPAPVHLPCHWHPPADQLFSRSVVCDFNIDGS